MTAPLQGLRITAASQDGQYATRQALELGVTRSQLATLRRRGEAAQVRPGVSRFAAAPGDADPAVTAVLACWPHAVVSHRSAGVRHGLKRLELPAHPEVTIEHGVVLRQSGITKHWSRSLDPCDLVNVGGIRFTTLERTVCDLADPHDAWGTLALVDDAVALLGGRRKVLHERASALSRGRAGVWIVRDATAPGAAEEFRSWLERTAAQLWRAGCLPEARWNVEVRDERGRIGVVDAMWEQWRVVVELECPAFHRTRSQRRRDAERFNRLGDAGYQVRRFTWEDVVRRPLWVLEMLYRALRAAGADLDLARIPRRVDLPALEPFHRRG